MAMPDDGTLVDEFENVLGVPFAPRWTTQISIDVAVARRLAQAVKGFYERFRLPEKDPGEMRPYLFHSYTTGKKPWQKFVEFSGNEYSFKPSPDTDLLAFLKPFLLYSHSISFYDPLPGLLDYFRPSPDESEYEKARLPGVAHLLSEYVKIADLIRHRIVVPISDEVFGVYSHNQFVVSDEEKHEITDLLAGIRRYQEQAKNVDLNSYIGFRIKEQLWLSQRAENRIDLYFPHESFVPILQGLLRAVSQRYNSKVIYEPFAASVFADLASIDTSHISISDIVSIRSENVFDDYRKVLQGILRRLQDREGKFSDLESEFAVAAREEMAECDDKIKQLTKKSHILRDTLNNLDRVLIGGASGALGGLTAGSPVVAVLGGAAGAAIHPLYDIVRGTWAASPSAAARASLRHHFLVLNPKDSKGLPT
jgi:hypothetical protein